MGLEVADNLRRRKTGWFVDCYMCREWSGSGSSLKLGRGIGLTEDSFEDVVRRLRHPERKGPEGHRI